MNIKACASVASEKTAPNSSRRYLAEVGPVEYAEKVRILADKNRTEKETLFVPYAGMSIKDIEQQIDVKNPK